MKRIVYIILFVFLVILGAWIYNRWNVWFGKHLEDLYVVKSDAHNIQLSFSRKGTQGRVVTWRMDVMKLSASLKYVNHQVGDTITLKPSIYPFSNNSGSAVYYSVEIPTSDVGVYSYSVCNDTIWYDFEVKKQSEFTVLCLGDIQNREKMKGNLIDSIVSFVEPDFIIQAGDLLESPSMKYWDVYFSDFGNITHSIPMLATLGNHDYHKFPNKYPDSRFYAVFPYLFDTSIDVKKPGTYTLKYGNVYFHIFDTNRFLPDLIKQADDFLSKGLNPDAYHVAVMHHPPYSAKSIWNNIDVRVSLVSALENGGIDLVIAGHEHLAELRKNTGENKLPFVQLISHLSQKNYSEKETDTRRFSILKYKDNQMVISIYDDSFEMKEQVAITES